MIEALKKFFNKNVYDRIISGIFFVIPFIYTIIEGGMLFIIFFSLLLVIIIHELNNSTRNEIRLHYRLLIIIFFIISIFHFIFLRIAFNDDLVTYLLYIVFSIWIFDSFSLIGGRLIGGRKIMPIISPNKTYSGLLSGIFSLIIFSFILIIFYNQDNIIILSSLIIGFISFAGDGIESYFKRFLKIKDFSNLMPGHGGILDRMDAFILFFLIHFIFSLFSLSPII